MAIRPEALAWMAGINKKLPGATTVAADIIEPRRFTSGSLSLDVALGGGFPGNKWTEILGYNSMGKTASILKAVAANQYLDPDLTVFWLAAEHFDTDQAKALGVDLSRITVAPTQKMELGLDFLVDATSSRAFDMVVCDSFPAMIHEEEDEKSMNEFSVAGGARKFNQFWRKAGDASARKFDNSERAFCGLMVNQWRDKIGFMGGKTSPGGQGKDFAYYARVDLTRVDWVKENRPGIKEPVKVGQTIKFRTIKNKSAAPQQTAEVDFYFRPAPLTGFRRGDYDLGKEYVTMAILFGIIEQRGGWFYYEGQKWNGKPALQDAIREDRGLQDKIAGLVLEVASDPSQVNNILDEQIAAAAASGTRKVSRRKS